MNQVVSINGHDLKSSCINYFL